MDDLHEKYSRLLAALRGCGRLAVAFSGGVDSAFLLRAAGAALGENVLALTGRFLSFPESEAQAAASLCRALGVRQLIVETDQTAIPAFVENRQDRCYHCKKALFSAFLNAAAEEGFPLLADGTNADDAGGYRPGMKALSELGVISPLKAAGLTKNEIRALSRELGLPTWDKPSLACLATRFPYGETLTKEKLLAADRAETLLRSLGLKQVRVRVHGNIARIETDPAAFPLLLTDETRALLTDSLRALGFLYVTLDLGGYQSGSMDRVLNKK